jgi:CelD/BcsL family acetyltransferase involved in cellulose biosynthesis
MRRDIRQARHRADRAGGWSIETASADTFRSVFSMLVSLHTARWTGRGEAGALADPRVITFHHAAGPRMIEHGLLRLQALRLDDGIAAVIYALFSAGRILFYLSGFDPSHAFESPGTILLAHMIEHAAREGRREADFLRGSERYKYAWGCIRRPNTGLSLTRP